MKRVLVFFVFALAGCSAVNLDNRVTCTVAKDKAFFVSEWGPVGVSATISEADRAAICK